MQSLCLCGSSFWLFVFLHNCALKQQLIDLLIYINLVDKVMGFISSSTVSPNSGVCVFICIHVHTLTFSWCSIRISTTMFWNLISMMAATVSSCGRSRVGPNTTPRLATVIRLCWWWLATLLTREHGEREREKEWVASCSIQLKNYF